MTTYSQLYWLTRLDSINTLSFIIVVICSIVIMFTTIHLFASFDYYNDEDKEQIMTKNIRKYSIYLLIPFSIITIFLPTKNEMIFIVAGTKTINFIEKDTSINKIPSQTTAIISKMLEENINKLDSSTKN